MWDVGSRCWFLIFFFFCLFGAVPAAYAVSQARGLIRAVAASLHHSHSKAGTYTTAHGNARSPTYQARPGVKPTSSWMLVGFVNHWAMTGTPSPHIYLFIYLFKLLNELYYIYSCTVTITTWFYSVSIPNPQPISTTCLIWKPCFSKSLSQYLFCNEVHCVHFLDSTCKW